MDLKQRRWPRVSPTKHSQCGSDSPPKAVSQPFAPFTCDRVGQARKRLNP